MRDGASQNREGKRKESSSYWRNSQYFRCFSVHGENIVPGFFPSDLNCCMLVVLN